MTRSELLLGLIVLAALCPRVARPNGAPDVDVAYAAAGGPLTPLQETTIRLVSERLLIDWTRDPAPARAEYRLDNPGPERTLRFGVPLLWEQRSIEPDSWAPDPMEHVKAGARSISISVDGRRHGCELSIPKDQKARPDAVLHRAVAGWCVAELRIPRGRVQLVLEYAVTGGVVFDPGPFMARRLVYPLWPAGYWKGPAEELSITVSVGELLRRGVKVVSPIGARFADDKIEWSFRNVDFKSLGSIVVDRNAVRFLAPWPDAGWIRARAELRATATSTLSSQGRHSYGAANAVDGRAETAWCEGAPGNGEGQGLEVEWTGPAPSPGVTCAVRDYEIVPGYARDAAAYENNGRVARARIESCDRPEDGFDVDLGPGLPVTPDGVVMVTPESSWPHLPDSWDRPPVEVHAPVGVLENERRCVRFRILKVVPGRKFSDTCVSEFVPRVYCKEVAGVPPATTR